MGRTAVSKDIGGWVPEVILWKEGEKPRLTMQRKIKIRAMDRNPMKA